MKTIAVFFALVAFAAAAPQLQIQQSAAARQDRPVQVVRELLHNNIGLDGYQYMYELDDGQKREENAQAVQTRDSEGNPSVALRVTGSYSFVGADGITYTVDYVADENGYRASGAHLPVAPAA